MAKKKLLFITNTIYSFGGGEKLVLEFASRMKKHFDITIATPVSKLDSIKMDRETLKRRYLDGIRLVELDAYGFKRKAFGTEPYVLRLLKGQSAGRLIRLIKETDFIYQVTLNPQVLITSTSFAKIYNKRLVLGLHNFALARASSDAAGPGGRLWNSVFMSAMRNVRVFHVTSSRDLRIIKARFPGAEVVYTPNFVMEKAGRAKNNAKRFICLYVGRFEKNQKGTDLLIEVIKLTIGRNKDIAFEIAGSGGDAEGMVKNLAERYPENVKWLGFVAGKRLDDAYDRASLLMLTSRSETFPLTLLEGQSHGLPAVAFEIPGPIDFMKSETQGKLIECFNIKRFSDAITEYYGLWKNGKGFGSRKLRIQRLVKREYNPDKIIPKVEGLILGRQR